MIVEENAKIELDIGATMRIHHGSSMGSYVENSMEAAQEVLSEDEPTDEENETGTVRDVLKALTP